MALMGIAMKNHLTATLGMIAGFGLGATTVQVIQAQPTPPAYTIAEVEVTDPETYKQYIAVGVPPPETPSCVLVGAGEEDR